MKMKIYHKKYLFILSVLIFIMASCKPESDTAQLIQSGSGDPAIDGISSLIQKDQNNANLYFDRAKLYYERQAYDQSINDLEIATKLDSTNPVFYHVLADVYLDYYRSRNALRTMQKVNKLFPERIPSMLKLSEVQLILKQYEESVRTVNQIIKIDPQNAEAYFMLGMNFRELKDTKRAINSFQTATEMDPDLIDAWIILGNLFEEANNPIAIQYFDNAIRVAPENIQALHSKAFYLQNSNKLVDAISIYKQINRLKPQYADAYLNTGILYLELDSINQAYEHFNILVNIEPGNHLAHYYRGISNLYLSKSEAAKSDFESCLNLNPDFLKAQEALDQLAEKIQ
jgi:tetratricopeptide (TPR) repeat protein